MMKRMILFLSMIAVVTMLCLTARAQTVLTDVWKDKTYQSTVKKVGVFLIMNNEANRILWEDEFVRQLKVRGINAMPVYTIIPSDKMVDKETALRKLKDLGVDAVLIVKLVDRLTAQTMIIPPDPSRRSGFYEYAFDIQTRGDEEPAYLETNLFDVSKTGQRVWTARSVTKVDKADSKLMSDFIKLILDRLVSDKMIP